MVLKKYCTFPQTPWLDPQHRIQFTVMPRYPLVYVWRLFHFEIAYFRAQIDPAIWEKRKYINIKWEQWIETTAEANKHSEMQKKFCSVEETEIY